MVLVFEAESKIKMKKKKHRLFLWFLRRSLTRSLRKKLLDSFTGCISVKKTNIFKRSSNGSIIYREEKVIFIRRDCTISIEEISKTVKEIFRLKGFLIGELHHHKKRFDLRTIFIRRKSRYFRVVISRTSIFSSKKITRIRVLPITAWPKQK